MTGSAVVSKGEALGTPRAAVALVVALLVLARSRPSHDQGKRATPRGLG
ncbi:MULTISPECIES: hypothetical protein [Bradyrhizobium]|nr:MULTISPECIES: hypothetical protein [Bradyrhizobium]MCA1377639.1 hypothetical protein [Bradyrhizobium sp. IC4060]MCA1476379.1 hypothetical protein [Bradyrhizobium sp. NBAIM08]MCA1483122.1 hypothetical protein [Bradyrhizobium sp. IC4061]MCA1549704.1 hypothetical protein [Bradyrhizobium sp. BRP19]UWU85444.1 hypothetical protein N2605_03000 [Bradyrhizobium sp. CB1024]